MLSFKCFLCYRSLPAIGLPGVRLDLWPGVDGLRGVREYSGELSLSLNESGVPDTRPDAALPMGTLRALRSRTWRDTVILLLYTKRNVIVNIMYTSNYI